jgi:hypothetical protein
MNNGRIYDEFRDALCGRWRSTCPTRTGNDHAIVAPYGMFRTEDGEVAPAPRGAMPAAPPGARNRRR